MKKTILKKKKEDQIENIPDLLCPILKEQIETAIVAEDGFTYDKSSLEQWFTSSTMSPMLGINISTNVLRANKFIDFLQAQVEYYRCSEAHFKSVVKEKQKYSIPHLNLELKKELDQILYHYFRLTKPLNELYKSLDSLIIKFPNSFQIQLEYANMLRFGAENEKALQFIQDAQRIEPNSCIPKYMEIRIASAKGNGYFGRETLETAQARQCISDNCLIEIRYLSSTFASIRCKERALNYISAYLLVYPNDMRAMLNQVYMYFNMFNYNKVLETSKKFLDKFKYDACVLYYRAKAFVFSEKKQEAFKLFDFIIKTSKEPIFIAQCLYDRACARVLDEEYEKVQQELRKAHQYYSKINADVCLSELYKNNQDYCKALEWLEIYGSRIDREKDIYYNRLAAEINENLGNREVALVSYNILRGIDAINDSYYENRIDMLLGNNEQ